MGCISKREINSNTILPQETRKTSNRQPNFIPKTTEKRRTKPPKISTRKEIIKIRAEIIEKEMKETIVKINKTKSWFFEKIKSTKLSVQFSSVQFRHSVVSDSLQPHELQHARPPCPSPTPRVHSNSCPSSR